MRKVIVNSLGLVAVFLVAGAVVAALPIRKPDAEATVEKVVPATDAEKQKGVLVTVFLKGRKDGVQVTKNTAVHRQMGKLVPIVEAGEIKAGVKVRVWIDAKTGMAEGVLIFP